MTATTTNNSNHRTRKQLSDQLDRLDGILDGLADALNESVATPVPEATVMAVQEAVQGVLKEVLQNPDIRERLLPPPPAAVPLPPSWRDRMNALKTGLANRWQDFRQGTQQAAQGVQQKFGTCWQGARQAVTKVWSRCQFLTRLRTQLLAAAGVGLLAANKYWTGPWLVGLLSGAGCLLATTTVQTVAFVGRVFGGLRPAP